MTATTLATGAPPRRAPGLLLGVGLGGFVDGIVIHQLLQWHHMVSHVDGLSPDTVPGLQFNTLADGLFHVVTWVCVVVGSTMAVADWRAGRRAPSWSFHIGLLLTGWGWFNLVEGIVDHHILGVHHVRDDLGGPLAWDLGFLALGALLVVVGRTLHRSGRYDTGRGGR